MNVESKFKSLSDEYLADVREPDIAGFVDQLFQIASETGVVECAVTEDSRIRFHVRHAPVHAGVLAQPPGQGEATCIVEHEAARTILRMICARLAAICKERTATEISPYGDSAVLEYAVENHSHWNVSFTNTPDHQGFLIEAL